MVLSLPISKTRPGCYISPQAKTVSATKMIKDIGGKDQVPIRVEDVITRAALDQLKISSTSRWMDLERQSFNSALIW